MWVIILQSDQQNYSKMLYETIAESRAHLLLPALLVAHSCAETLVLRSSPQTLKEKRDCSQSNQPGGHQARFQTVHLISCNAHRVTLA